MDDTDLGDLDFGILDHHAEEADGEKLQRLINRRDAMLRDGKDVKAHDLDAEIEALQSGIDVAQARQEMQGGTATELEEARARITELETRYKDAMAKLVEINKAATSAYPGKKLHVHMAELEARADRDRMDAQAQAGEFVDGSTTTSCEKYVTDCKSMSVKESAMRLYIKIMVVDGYRLERMDPDDGMTEINVDEAIEHLRGEIKTIWATKTTRIGDDYSSSCFQITGEL